MKTVCNSQVRLHLLTAVMKCFFKRPPETQKALGAALAAGLADFHQVRVDFFFFDQDKDMYLICTFQNLTIQCLNFIFLSMKCLALPLSLSVLPSFSFFL